MTSEPDDVRNRPTGQLEHPRRPLEIFAARYGLQDANLAAQAACTELLAEAGYVAGRPDMERVLGVVGAVVRHEPFRESGRLSVEGETYVITVSTAGNERRQVFSIAHELGHILLFEGLVDEGPELLTQVAMDHQNAAVERLCNRAASELLMPVADFRERLFADRLTTGMVLDLADFYGVSRHAALTRIAEVVADTRVILLRRDLLTSGRSQRYYEVDTLPRGVRKVVRRYMTASAMRPNVIEKSVDGNGPASSKSVRLDLPGMISMVRRALVIPAKDPTSGRRILGRGSDEASADDSDVDHVLILQKPTAPVEEWAHLTGGKA